MPRRLFPVLTYDDTMRFHFNGERIDLMHFGPAHTTGDTTAVIFRGHKSVHLGDVYNNAGYPFIDADNGEGHDRHHRVLLEGARADRRNLYRGARHGAGGRRANAGGIRCDANDDSRSHNFALIASGATLEQVVAAPAPTSSEWDERKGSPDNFLDRAYLSLTRERR